jgi:F0F1-type ATP synthase assembly protein I
MSSQPPDRPPPPQPADAWGVVGYLVAGTLLYGGLGWLLDALLGTGFLLPIGLVLGMALALYLTVMRYGRM